MSTTQEEQSKKQQEASDMNFFAFNRGFEAEEFEAEEFEAEFLEKGKSKAPGQSHSPSQLKLFASPDDVFPVYQPMEEPEIYEASDNFIEEPIKITSPKVVNDKDAKLYFSNKIEEEEEESATEVTSHHEASPPAAKEMALNAILEERPLRWIKGTQSPAATSTYEASSEEPSVGENFGKLLAEGRAFQHEIKALAKKPTLSGNAREFMPTATTERKKSPSPVKVKKKPKEQQRIQPSGDFFHQIQAQQQANINEFIPQRVAQVPDQHARHFSPIPSSHLWNQFTRVPVPQLQFVNSPSPQRYGYTGNTMVANVNEPHFMQEPHKTREHFVQQPHTGIDPSFLGSPWKPPPQMNVQSGAAPFVRPIQDASARKPDNKRLRPFDKLRELIDRRSSCVRERFRDMVRKRAMETSPEFNGKDHRQEFRQKIKMNALPEMEKIKMHAIPEMETDIGTDFEAYVKELGFVDYRSCDDEESSLESDDLYMIPLSKELACLQVLSKGDELQSSKKAHHVVGSVDIVEMLKKTINSNQLLGSTNRQSSSSETYMPKRLRCDEQQDPVEAY